MSSNRNAFNTNSPLLIYTIDNTPRKQRRNCKNPWIFTLKTLSELLDTSVLKKNSKKIRVVVRTDFNLAFGYKGAPPTVAPHRQLTLDDKCYGAADIYFNIDNKVEKIKPKSGDFKPDYDSLKVLLLLLKDANIDFTDTIILEEYKNPGGGNSIEHEVSKAELFAELETVRQAYPQIKAPSRTEVESASPEKKTADLPTSKKTSPSNTSATPQDKDKRKSLPKTSDTPHQQDTGVKRLLFSSPNKTENYLGPVTSFSLTSQAIGNVPTLFPTLTLPSTLSLSSSSSNLACGPFPAIGNFSPRSPYATTSTLSPSSPASTLPHSSFGFFTPDQAAFSNDTDNSSSHFKRNREEDEKENKENINSQNTPKKSRP